MIHKKGGRGREGGLCVFSALPTQAISSSPNFSSTASLLSTFSQIQKATSKVLSPGEMLASNREKAEVLKAYFAFLPSQREQIKRGEEGAATRGRERGCTETPTLLNESTLQGPRETPPGRLKNLQRQPQNLSLLVAELGLEKEPGPWILEAGNIVPIFKTCEKEEDPCN